MIIKIKFVFVVLIVGILFLPNYVKAQELSLQNEISTIHRDSLRSLFIYSGVGLFEWFNLGLGFQINPQLSISLKHANTWVSGHGGNYLFPPNASGIGVDLKYFRDLWIFNNLSIDYVYYLYVPNIYDNSYSIQYKGNYFAINLGSEKAYISKQSKMQLFWSVGLGVSYTKSYDKTLIFPSIKVGIIHNLF